MPTNLYLLYFNYLFIFKLLLLLLSKLMTNCLFLFFFKFYSNAYILFIRTYLCIRNKRPVEKFMFYDNKTKFLIIER